MNVLIIGGTRFIGPYVVRRLLYLGHNVMVFSRNQSLQSLLDRIWHIWGDRDAIHSFRPEFKKWAPDVVLDMCAYTEAQAQQTIAALKDICPRIVVVSSMDVYRGWDRFFVKAGSSALERTPFTEDAPLRETFYPRRAAAKDPSDPEFDYEKILVERTMSNCPGLACTILRLPAVYGPGDYRRRLFDMVKRMDDKRPFILMEPAQASWMWTWGYVEDVAHAIALAVVDVRSKNQVYNVGEKLPLTQEEWVLRVARVTGWRGRIILLDADQMPGHLKDSNQRDFTQHLTLDTTKIRRDLGFNEQVPFEQGLIKTIEWTRTLKPDPAALKDFDYEAEDACVNSALLPAPIAAQS
ncbi:MAG TPA: NAD-dependent epimerase/dehydratase family protein [Candidatus Sulfotelmatobacter sp.]|nr:NAD-dependent epimerase/dehydratase family protein [Candidatus Sulfotelmatobacter sp.]